jgi:maltoporin
VLLTQGDGSARAQFGQVGRIGAIPFLTPAGRGNFARPHIQAFYMLTLRDDGARRLYPVHDVFSMRNVDHFIGIGAEWWFDSTSYFRD